MADHHIDSMKDFDYVAAAEAILKKRGLFIVDAPHINHKPGNDFWSDVNYPFPNDDERWANPANDNNQIKNPKTEVPKGMNLNEKDYGQDIKITKCKRITDCFVINKTYSNLINNEISIKELNKYPLITEHFYF